MGIKQLIRKAARKAVGYDDSLNALFYYVNHLHSITEFPKATGDLRLLQLADVKLLQIIDAICQKNGLEYWMDSGTLLGAVRHKGFIPWDDDTDLCMDRENYLKAREILPEVCAHYGIDVKEAENCRGGWIGIGYKHKDTGIWADIFPMDYSCEDITIPERRKQLESEVKAFHKRYQKKMKTDPDMDKQAGFKRKIIPSICGKDQAKTLVIYCEFWSDVALYQYSDVFPLKRIDFDGAFLLAPNNSENYLKEYFGDYMQFPRWGILHHAEGRPSLETWAKLSGTDMKQVLVELDEIICRIALP